MDLSFSITAALVRLCLIADASVDRAIWPCLVECHASFHFQQYLRIFVVILKLSELNIKLSTNSLNKEIDGERLR